jgi:hypothetical protein
MADAAVAVAPEKQWWRHFEFYTFCVISFAGKSMLLIRLPYREWPINTAYTCALLLFFYCYFRFRQDIKAPLFVVLSLATAVAVDIFGNRWGLYGHPFGPLRDYDEFAHFAGSGFSAVAAIWLLRAGTRRMGYKLSPGLLGFMSTTIAFTYCGWYEILELWDELFYGDFVRIHTWDDTPNDLFYDFLGVIVFVAAVALFFRINEHVTRESPGELAEVTFRNVLSALPKNLLAVLFATTGFGLCSWFEIVKMFHQRWRGSVHFAANRDCALNLQLELLISVVIAITAAVAIGYGLNKKVETA